MRDVTRKQVQVLFELSTGKRLYANESTKLAFLSENGDRDVGDLNHFESFLALLENDCLTFEKHGATHGEVVYKISNEGSERLLETSMRPEEG